MKKLFCIGCLLLIGALGGCSAAEVVETYTLTTEYEGYKIEEKIVLYGRDDDTLEKGEEHITISFDGSQIALEEKELYKESLLAFNPDSKYIEMNWSETESSIVYTTTTDFKQAKSDKAAVYKDEIYSDNLYYSMKETASGHLDEGYILVVEEK